MRVLMIVGHRGIYSGGAHQALYAIRGLLGAGVEVGAVWGEDPEAGAEGFAGLADLKIPYWVLPVDKNPTLGSLWSLGKVLRKFRPDVIEAVKSSAQLHALKRTLLRMRVGLVFYQSVSRPLSWGESLKYRLGRVDRIIVDGNALKETMINAGKIRADKIDVIFNEFDATCIDPHRVNSYGLRRDLRIPDGVPIVTQLGDFTAWRGQETTLRAAAILIRNDFRFHLLLAGRQTENLAPLVKQLGLSQFVTLSPYRRDPERLLKESYVAVGASTDNESISGALLNAQAMGVPAVASATMGNLQAVEDGVTGFIFPIGDVNGLAEALGTILRFSQGEHDYWRRLSRDRAMRLFSPDIRTKARLACYHLALEHRGRRAVS